MGNPTAGVKLIEYGSYTCSHCATFDQEGAQPLIDKYVKTGRVSFEFRNFLRDGLDMSMSLIARCAGPERFFPLSDAMFKDQRQFFERAQAATPEQQKAASASSAGLEEFGGL